ncbi:alanyl-tRNA editing protein Aarsd1-B [Cylas formicarius]|uniref:alanyl-tRNA editing protein Aarsd1-B n=1 Tax=Cylas formicarius TaxID=197179 RepID=UPI002958625A|nr:alanyl-tRNA editing protein Aarsd1-B [Cylas formicarius]
MVFKCQNDSFLREFVTKVVSCEKTEINKVINGKKTKCDGFEVILEDTILFPEGGGQPCDYGYLNDIPVNQIVRKTDKAVHYTHKPLQIGEEVKQVLDWERRFDHMQQHSGQHLITAIIDRDFKIQTVSWWLGEEVSYIELDVAQISEDQISYTENVVNNLIREFKKVTVEIYTEDTPEEQLKEARSARGLPADHKGDIRVVRIEDIEGNMCCGTHVSNLSQLQVIKLLHSEKSKRKDKTFLYFLVGNRVLKRLSGCIEREQRLTALLKNNPVDHTDLVDKLQKNVKTLTKNLQNVLRELAILEAENLKKTLPRPSFFFLHKKEADLEFINIFIKEVGEDKDILLFLSTGDEKAIGNMVLYGEEKAVADLGPKICDLLEGKGAGKGNRFQAKVYKMSNRPKAEALIEEYFRN